MTEKLLADFLNKQTFDIRKTRNGRWIDQKCAPDAISFVADCVLHVLDEKGGKQFRSPEVWRSDFAITNVQSIFGKPNPLDDTTIDEYNKFFRQPLKMLSAAGVLKERKVGQSILFELIAPDVLIYLSRRPWNAQEFLHLYVEKTLRDSGLWDSFATFLELQTLDAFSELKTCFTSFCHRYTPIQTSIEVGRIFPKVLNPLALFYQKRGTIAGRLSPKRMVFDELRYNRENSRDIGKEKNVSRRNGRNTESMLAEPYFISKAKKEVSEFNKSFNDGKSEVLGPNSRGIATQMHHIFPRYGFPDLASLVENIIALTPSQHLTLAHPNNQTSKIDPNFQYSCLLSRNETIKKNILGHYGTPGFYSFSTFSFMLDVGFGTDFFQKIPENDFAEIRNGIESRFE